jgi:hypothetical protein
LYSKAFLELDAAELKFVLAETTELEYSLERKVIEEAATLFEDDEVVVPIPLIIPQKSKSVAFGYMPVYQSLLLVAATIIFMVLIFPIHTENGSFKTKTEYIVKTDTVEIEKEIYKYDTIYQTVEKPIYIKQDVYVENNSVPCVNPIQEEPRLFQPSHTINLPELTEELTNANGRSLKDDNLSSLIVEFER